MSSVVQRGGETFYTIAAAREAVHEFESKGVAVSGIEGFRITESSTEPLLDYIAHWPIAPAQPKERYVRESALYCLRTLARWEPDAPPDFMVSIAVGDE